MPRYTIDVNKNMQGMRFDLALVAADLGLSRRQIRATIDAGGAYIGKRRIRLASHKVQAGDRLVLEHQPNMLKQIAAAKRQPHVLNKAALLYADTNLVVINKPPGLPAQPTRSQARWHACAAAQELCQRLGLLKPGQKLQLVHRLDQETSGLMVFGVNPSATEQLMAAFKARQIKKIYHAITGASPTWERKTIDLALAKPGKIGLVSPHPQGKPALTHCKVISRSTTPAMSLIECRPVTGRTHQIRVHLAQTGCGILGDKKYGHRSQDTWGLSHHLLHAASLELPKLSPRQPKSFSAPWPETMLSLASQSELKIPDCKRFP